MKSKLKLEKGILSVIIVSVYLIVYLILLQFENTRALSIMLLLFFPAVIIGMTYAVLQYSKCEEAEPGEKEFRVREF